METLKKAVFTNCNNNFVPYSIVALRLFKKHNPDYDMFILGTDFTNEYISLAAEYNVNAININMSKDFIGFENRPHFRELPIDCFCRFKAYKILHQYDYLVFIDPDIYTGKKLDIPLSSAKYVLGSRRHGNKLVHIIGGIFNIVKQKYPITIDQDRILPGFRIYNVKGLIKISFFEKILEYWKDSFARGYHMSEDDSTSSLYQLIHPEHIKLVEHKYAILFAENSKYTPDNIVHYHFGGPSPKPWSNKKQTYSVGVILQLKYKKYVLDNYPSNFIKKHINSSWVVENNKTTIVTCLFDLHSKEKWQGRRDFNKYLEQGEGLMKIDSPMVIFTSEDLRDPIMKIRKKYGHQEKTHICVTDLKDLQGFRYLDKISKIYGKGGCPAGNKANEKESPKFISLVNSKVDMVVKAIDKNIFKTKYYAWSDIAIYYVKNIKIASVNNTNKEILKMFKNLPKGKINTCCICETHPNETRNRKTYYSRHRYKIVSGFISGDISSWEKLNKLYYQELEKSISVGHPALEEPILGAISAEHRDLFNLYYGDYEDIFRSYFTCKSKVSTLMIAARHMARYRMNELFLKFSSKILRSHGYKDIKLPIGDLYFICEHLINIPMITIVKNKEFIFAYERARFHLNLDLNISTKQNINSGPLSGKEIDNKYLPEYYRGQGGVPKSWKDYLKVLNFDQIFSMPLVFEKDPMSHIPKIPKSHRTTIVTIFLDVHDFTGEKCRRETIGSNFDNYIKKAQKLLDTDRPMIIVVSPTAIEKVRKYRSDKGLMEKTVILSLKLNKTPYYYLKPLISQCFEESRTSRLLDSKSFSHRALLPIFYNKIKLLEYASQVNHFNSQNFLWLDFAIFSDPGRFDKFSTVERITDTLPDNKVRICLIEDSSKDEIKNRELFYRTKRWKAIGGHISVPKRHMAEFVSLWNQELRKSLEVGIPAFEEQILACVKAMKPEIFSCYYGDYVNLFNSYYDYNTDDYITLRNLRHCRNYKIWDVSVFIAQRLLEMTNKDILSKGYNIESLAKIYDELLIGCWYGGRKDLSKQAAQKTMSLSKIHGLDRKLVKHLNKNLIFHGFYIE